MINVDAQTASVVGKGVVTLRFGGVSTEFASGQVLPLERLRDPSSVGSANLATPAVASGGVDAGGLITPQVLDSNLRQATDRLNSDFAAALANGDADAAGRAALELDDAIAGWSADTLQSDDADNARAVLRSMITRLAGAATGGLRDPREVFSPLVQVLLHLRVLVRADKRFDLSDMIRDRLADLKIEVRDTPDGAQWDIRP